MLDGPKGSGNSPSPTPAASAPSAPAPGDNTVEEIKVEDIPF